MSDLLNSASLVLIPSGYKEDVLYSQVPTDGSADMAFTRASNGTRVNSAGLVEVCPWNLWTGSDNFSATDWVQYQLTPTTGTTTDIYGNSSTVYKLIGNVTNSYCFINRSSDGAANTAFSVYAKPNGYTKIGISNRSGNPWNFVVDLVTKVVSNIYDSASSIVSINVLDAVGDWKRIEVVLSTAIQYNLHPLPSNFNSTNFDNVTLNGTDGVWVMASQVNSGSTAKPYFPTTDRLNVPRLTYQNGGGGCPSLLLEKQSTNLTLYSEQLDNAAHSQLNVTITANNITSPDGTQNADKITETTGTGEHIVYDIDTNATGTYTLSAFFKGGEGTIYPVLRLNGSNTTGYAGCIFNTSTGAVVNTFYNTYSAPTTKVENMGNGWYRVSMTTTTTDANFGMRIAASNSASPSIGAYGAISYTGSTSNYFYAYGAQLEASSYPTSYIPTTSSSATRVADTCSKTGISSLIGQTEGTIFVDLVYNGSEAQTGNIFSFDQSTSGSVVIIRNANGSIGTAIWDGSAKAVFNGGSMPIGQRTKIAYAYKSGSTALFVNGVQIGSDSGSTFTLPTISQIYLNSVTAYFAFQQSASFNEAVIFKTRLTNSELAQLTA